MGIKFLAFYILFSFFCTFRWLKLLCWLSLILNTRFPVTWIIGELQNVYLQNLFLFQTQALGKKVCSPPDVEI